MPKLFLSLYLFEAITAILLVYSCCCLILVSFTDSLGAAVNQPSSDLSESLSALELRLKVKVVNGLGFLYFFDSKNLNVLNHTFCFGAGFKIGALPEGFILELVILFVFLSTSGTIILAFFSL